MTAARNPDIEDLVRERAHKIWIDEGQPEGRAEDHWLRAQEELQRELAAAKPHPEIATALEPELAAAPQQQAAGIIPDSEPIPEVDPVPDPGVKESKPTAGAKPVAPRKPRK